MNTSVGKRLSQNHTKRKKKSRSWAGASGPSLLDHPGQEFCVRDAPGMAGLEVGRSTEEQLA